MSEVYIVESSDIGTFRRTVMEAPNSDDVLRLIARRLGETSLANISLSIDSVRIFRNTDPEVTSDVLPGPAPVILIATGRAALDGDQPRAAALTIHPETNINSGCEIEILDLDDIG